MTQKSSISSISTSDLQRIVDELKHQSRRNSTRQNYYSIWKHFNQFYLRLDSKPDTLEERLVLFAGHLISNKRKANTIKSYISAIRAVLSQGGYHLSEDRTLLGALTRATRIHNDVVYNCLPIRKILLTVLINSVE